MLSFIINHLSSFWVQKSEWHEMQGNRKKLIIINKTGLKVYVYTLSQSYKYICQFNDDKHV